MVPVYFSPCSQRLTTEQGSSRSAIQGGSLKLGGHASIRRPRILFHHQLHSTPGLRIATELAERAEQVFKCRCPRTLGSKPLSAAVKAPVRWIALKTRYRKFGRRMAVRTSDLDRCKIGQTDIHRCMAHSYPFARALGKRSAARPYGAKYVSD